MTAFRLAAKAFHENNMPVCNFLIEVPLTGVIIPIKQFFIHLLDSAAGFDFPVKNGDGILFKRTHGPARRVI